MVQPVALDSLTGFPVALQVHHSTPDATDALEHPQPVDPT
jgi:hypothetical protein